MNWSWLRCIIIPRLLVHLWISSRATSFNGIDIITWHKLSSWLNSCVHEILSSFSGTHCLRRKITMQRNASTHWLLRGWLMVVLRPKVKITRWNYRVLMSSLGTGSWMIHSLDRNSRHECLLRKRRLNLSRLHSHLRHRLHMLWNLMRNSRCHSYMLRWSHHKRLSRDWVILLRMDLIWMIVKLILIEASLSHGHWGWARAWRC